MCKRSHKVEKMAWSRILKCKSTTKFFALNSSLYANFTSIYEKSKPKSYFLNIADWINTALNSALLQVRFGCVFFSILQQHVSMFTNVGAIVVPGVEWVGEAKSIQYIFLPSKCMKQQRNGSEKEAMKQSPVILFLMKVSSVVLKTLGGWWAGQDLNRRIRHWAGWESSHI